MNFKNNSKVYKINRSIILFFVLIIICIITSKCFDIFLTNIEKTNRTNFTKPTENIKKTTEKTTENIKKTTEKTTENIQKNTNDDTIQISKCTNVNKIIGGLDNECEKNARFEIDRYPNIPICVYTKNNQNNQNCQNNIIYPNNQYNSNNQYNECNCPKCKINSNNKSQNISDNFNQQINNEIPIENIPIIQNMPTIQNIPNGLTIEPIEYIQHMQSLKLQSDLNALRDYDYRTLNDPLVPPLKRDDYGGIVPSVYTRGYPSDYKKMGVLIDEETDNNDKYKFLILFGRLKYQGGTLYDYYAIENNDGYMKFDIPHIHKELYSDDTIRIKELNKTYKVNIDRNLNFNYGSFLYI
jgi:hypothetical protein